MSEKNNINTILDVVSSMTAIELMELVKAIEEKFGVSAAMQVVAGPAAGSDDSQAVAKEEKVEFKVVIKDAGSNAIGVIKALRSVLPLGLKEAKDLAVSGAIIKENANKEESEKIKKALAEAGAVVDIV